VIEQEAFRKKLQKLEYLEKERTIGSLPVIGTYLAKFVPLSDVETLVDGLVVELNRRVEENKFQHKQCLESMRDFYARLPNIQNPSIALTEFKAHNDELIDYILALSDVVDWVFDQLNIGMEDKQQ
jgi:hypothetical protein